MEGDNVITNVTARLGLLGPLESIPSDVYNVNVLRLLLTYVRIAKILLQRSNHTYIIVTKTGPFHSHRPSFGMLPDSLAEMVVYVGKSPPATPIRTPHDSIVLFTGSC